MKTTSKNILYLCLIGCLSFLWMSCNKEAALTNSGYKEYGYIVPQGNHPYDQRIVNYYNKWGIAVLYNFTQQDINWKISGYDATYKSVPADTNYISNQLDLIDTTFFRFYQDSTLKQYLPLKVFLCSSLMYLTTWVDAYGLNSTTSTTLGGYQSFPINWGSSRITHLVSGTANDSAVVLRGNINFSFLKVALINGTMVMSPNFAPYSDYTTALVATNNAPRYKRGFLGVTSSYTSLPSAPSDWYYYIQAAVSNTYANLTSTATTSADATYKGILSSVKDSSGLINQKYNFVVNYYKTRYNIDLQKIGNGGR